MKAEFRNFTTNITLVREDEGWREGCRSGFGFVKRCFTFHLFKGKYEAIPCAEIAFEDPEECYKKYNDTEVAELKCY